MQHNGCTGCRRRNAFTSMGHSSKGFAGTPMQPSSRSHRRAARERANKRTRPASLHTLLSLYKSSKHGTRESSSSSPSSFLLLLLCVCVCLHSIRSGGRQSTRNHVHFVTLMRRLISIEMRIETQCLTIAVHFDLLLPSAPND